MKSSAGCPYDLIIYRKKDDKKCVGFFKVVAEPQEVGIIYYMFIRNKSRGRGYATAALNRLKENFACLKTQVSASSKDSLDYLKSQGFRTEGNWTIWGEPLKKKSLIM